jgi:hypothetical protein
MINMINQQQPCTSCKTQRGVLHLLHQLKTHTKQPQMLDNQLLATVLQSLFQPKALIFFGAFASVWLLWFIMLFFWLTSTFKQQEKELETLYGTALQPIEDAARTCLAIGESDFPENPAENCLF